MACCAFAVFLLGQIALAFDGVRTFLFGASDDAEVRPNAAVDWQLGMAAQVHAPRFKLAVSPKFLAAGIGAELAIMAGGFVGWAAYAGQSPSLDFAMTYICRGGQIVLL